MSGKELWLGDNFTQVSNDILEALAMAQLSTNEFRIILFIIRKTYGWHKQTDWIALSQIVEGTGIAKPNVCRTLNSLKRKNIIVRPDSRHVGLQDDIGFWVSKKLPVQKTKNTKNWDENTKNTKISRIPTSVTVI